MAGQQINAYNAFNQYGRNQYNSAPFAYNQYAQSNPNRFAYTNPQMQDTVAFGNAEAPVAPAEMPEKKSNSKTWLIAGGIALAAAGLIFHKRIGKALGFGEDVVKGSEKLTKNSETTTKNLVKNEDMVVDTLAKDDKIMTLKIKIKEQYIKERASILKEHNKKYNNLGIQKSFNINGTKDWDLANINNEIEKCQAQKITISNKIKTTIQQLQSDKDWVELRKLRKEFQAENKIRAKDVNGRETEPYRLNREKLSLIDHVLAQKATGDTLRFNLTTGLDVADAVGLIKTNAKTLEEFTMKQDSLGKYELVCGQVQHTLNAKDSLHLDNFFKGDIKDYKKLNGTIEYLNLCYQQNSLAAQDLQNELISLANRVRKTDDVKSLKEFSK